MKKFKIRVYTPVEDKNPTLFNKREDADNERRNLNNLQPENLFIIEETYI